MSLTSNMKINSERLWDSLMEMARIGPGIAGGNNRQTLTDADGETQRGAGREPLGAPQRPPRIAEVRGELRDMLHHRAGGQIRDERG